MTKKLYDDFPYETEFRSKVVSCENSTARPDAWEVVLDATLFFPEEGGQTPDQGTLGGFLVVDVQIREDVITHTVVPASDEKHPKPLSPGEEVEGRIDWTHRFSNMQQHTGEHIFSGLVHSAYGYENVGFHLSDSIVTMDYDGTLSREQVEELELKANEVIFQNLPVTAEYPSEEKLSRMEYRCKKELAPPIRIVAIKDVDVCACCAPHVRSTAEVGILKVMDVTNYKGGVRLSILCGMRALKAFTASYDRGIEISHLTSRPPEEIAEAVKGLQKESGRLKQKLNEAASELLSWQVKAAEESKGEDDAVFLFTDGCDMRLIRNAVNDLMERHSNLCGIFNRTSEDTYAYLLGSKTIDCRDVAKRLNEEFSGKGGGQAAMVQGSIKGREEDIRRTL